MARVHPSRQHGLGGKVGHRQRSRGRGPRRGAPRRGCAPPAAAQDALPGGEGSGHTDGERNPGVPQGHLRGADGDHPRDAHVLQGRRLRIQPVGQLLLPQGQADRPAVGDHPLLGAGARLPGRVPELPRAGPVPPLSSPPPEALPPPPPPVPPSRAENPRSRSPAVDPPSALWPPFPSAREGAFAPLLPRCFFSAQRALPLARSQRG
mmetsp:Transcript_947/g.2242  ORF Transcript_947/g.2242 Transcript_947/m.2242 type:complete len:207 (+) Transcript_947:1623-2243(+)